MDCSVWTQSSRLCSLQISHAQCFQTCISHFYVAQVGLAKMSQWLSKNANSDPSNSLVQMKQCHCKKCTEILLNSLYLGLDTSVLKTCKNVCWSSEVGQWNNKNLTDINAENELQQEGMHVWKVHSYIQKCTAGKITANHCKKPTSVKPKNSKCWTDWDIFQWEQYLQWRDLFAPSVNFSSSKSQITPRITVNSPASKLCGNDSWIFWGGFVCLFYFTAINDHQLNVVANHQTNSLHWRHWRWWNNSAALVDKNQWVPG